MDIKPEYLRASSPIIHEQLAKLHLASQQYKMRSHQINVDLEQEDDASSSQEDKSTHLVKRLQDATIQFINQYRTVIRLIIFSVLFVAFTVYFAFAVRHSVAKAKALVVLTSLVFGYIVYAWIRDHFGHLIAPAVCLPLARWWDRHWNITRWFVFTVLFLVAALYLIMDVIRSWRQLQSLGGLVVFFVIPWLTSKYPKQICWRPVMWGIVLQFVIGCLVLRWKHGYNAVKFLSDQFSTFLGYSLEGGAQVFSDPYFIRHPFAMVVVPLIIYLGCVMAILYYWGVIQWVAAKIGWLMSISLHTTPIESVSLVVNIFLSVLDAVLMLKDYMPYLTPSEFHCFLVGAHSTIAGFAFGLFILFGVSPQHLLTGAVMSAPAAVAFAKLNFPETKRSYFKTIDSLTLMNKEDTTFMDAAIRGAWAAGKSVATILVQTIAFISLYGFMNAAVTWMFDRVGVADVDIATILGYLFIPFSFLMGVDWDDALKVGRLIGLKVTANEFLAYIELGVLKGEGEISVRSATIATYAMCGFSSFGTLVIFSGVWQTVDSTRTVEVLRQIPRIMLNANLSCFMTACFASILYSEEIDIDEGNGTLGSLIDSFMNLLPDYESVSSFLQLAIS